VGGVILSVHGLSWAKGYVVCSIIGKHIELFINMAVNQKLEFWDFQVLKNDQAVFSISLSDFFKLRPILKKTYTRIHVQQKVGLPFVFVRLGRRKGIATGIIFFFIILYLLSSMVWTINIEGNKVIKDAEIFQAMRELGIHRGMFKYQLPNYNVLQEQLEARLPQASWIGVKVSGTHLQLTVSEKVIPSKTKSLGPQHIVSNRNAVIIKILAEKGIPVVQVNDRVKKGDILISGLLGSSEEQQAVTAIGEVRGLVWYQSNITIPLTQQWEEYTGELIEREYLSIGKRMIKIKGEKIVPFKKYQSIYSQKVAKLKNYQVPLTFIHEKVLEYKEHTKKLTEKEAVDLAIEQAKKDLLHKVAAGSLIKEQKVLRQSVENGKVKLEVLFEVDEDIKNTLPIVQGE